MTAKFNNLFEILGCKSYNTILADNGFYVEIASWYERSTRKFQLIFKKEGEQCAVKYAVRTVSEKRVVKEVNNFINECA